jgi:serine/threonine protein kinase
LPPSSPPPANGKTPSRTDDDRAPRDAAEDSGLRSIVLEEGSLLAQKYRLSRPAGFGGMAQLWVAKNEATGAEVCIKILVPEKSDDESVERFRREAYAAARLSHRAIVRIFDLVELGPDGEATKGKPAALAIVMELLHGETLGDHLMKRGALPVEESMDLALPILSALAHAHRAGVVHRDLKPDNIFLATDPDGHVIPKVLDFGVSKVAITGEHALKLKASTPQPVKALTLDGVMLGTPSFMSPEQARGARDVDARSDVFSAGILVYMMLTGKNPFESDSFHAVIASVLTLEVPRPPGVPDAIWQVLQVSLAKDSKVRYGDATEQGIALRRAAGRATTTDSGVHTPVVFPSSSRKLKIPLGGDSHVSVPPVGSSEVGDAAGDPPYRVPTAASRRRSIRIVAAVLGASVVMMVVALLRGPTGGAAPPSDSATSASGQAPAAATSSVAPAPTEPVKADPPPSAVTSAANDAPRGAATATTTATGIAAATATVAAAPDAGVVVPSMPGPPAAETTAPLPTTAPATALPAPPVTAATAALKKALPSGGSPLAAPTSTGFKEPSIVRDPGF